MMLAPSKTEFGAWHVRRETCVRNRRSVYESNLPSATMANPQDIQPAELDRLIENFYVVLEKKINDGVTPFPVGQHPSQWAHDNRLVPSGKKGVPVMTALWNSNNRIFQSTPAQWKEIIARYVGF